MECRFMCDDGVERDLDISAEATVTFSCVYQKRLHTPKGTAVALGVHAGKLYVLLDENAKSLVATPFTKKDHENGLLEVLPDSPVVVSPTESHRVKQNVFCGRCVNIVTQDHNGPCPVLAAANALVLLGRLTLCEDSCRQVDAQQLRMLILTYITEGRPAPPNFACPLRRIVDGSELNTSAGLVQQSLEKERARLAEGNRGEEFLKKMYHGMNISPIFSGADAFEADDDLLLFAHAGLRVFHGWLIPPASRYAALREMSFNEVSLLATNSDSSLSVLAKEFLESTKSQLTEEGLKVLRQELSEGEVVVFFWNNHFSTAVNLGGRLLLLLSDETYADRSSIMFEVVEDVHGAATFTDGNGVDADPFLLAIQSLTGNEFTEASVSEARAKLQLLHGSEPSPEAAIVYLRNTSRKGDVSKGEQKREHPTWVLHGATLITEMGFDVDYAHACELVKQHGSVSAVVSKLCLESSKP